MTNGDILEQSGNGNGTAGAGVVAPILVRSYASRSDLFRAMARRGGRNRWWKAKGEPCKTNINQPCGGNREFHIVEIFWIHVLENQYQNDYIRIIIIHIKLCVFFGDMKNIKTSMICAEERSDFYILHRCFDVNTRRPRFLCWRIVWKFEHSDI